MLVAVLVYAYLAGLFGWLAIHLAFHDRLWWVFLAGSFGACLFAPLPLAFVAALATHRADLLTGCAAALAVFLFLYGGLFLPRRASVQAGRSFSVLTYNVMAVRRQAPQLIAALRASGADVIALQELNPRLASALAQQLVAAYPYQLLDPRSTASGMGLLSRYPLRVMNEQLPGAWLGTPQLATLDVAGAAVTIINIHNVSLPTGGPNWQLRLSLSIQQREEQARRIVAFTQAHPGPCVVVGDFNTTDQSEAYRTLTSALGDSWRERGFGLGHTFPGGSSPGATRLLLLGIPLPPWLARIDYVFHTRGLLAIAARIGPWDGVSDHRPVLAQLAFLPEHAQA